MSGKFLKENRLKCIPHIWLSFTVGVVTVLLFARASFSFAPPVVEENVQVLAHFDQKIQPDFLVQPGVTSNHNGVLDPSGKWGQSLKLVGDAYVILPTQTFMGSQSGTVMFWVYPLWASDDSRSHVFLSMGWNDGKNGYFAISNGWWEPAGTGRLYFIFNNESYIHTSAKSPLVPGRWYHLTMTWKVGDVIKIFLDGKLFSYFAYESGPTFSPGTPLYLGTDLPASHGNGRQADALIDELVLYSRALSYDEILDRYENQKGQIAPPPENPLGTLPKQGALLGDYERRAIMDEGYEWALSPAHIDAVLDRIHQAGFNIYIPCVWHGTGVRFSTTRAPIDPELIGSISTGFDPLAYLIKRAHALGIEVHPWFTVVLRQRDFLTQFYDNGTPPLAFNVHNSAFREFMADLILDVANKYDIDGINLDYIRSIGICQSTFCKNNYAQSTGRNLSLDALAYGVSTEAGESIAGWNRKAVSQIVQTISDRLRLRKPHLILSGDGNPNDRGPQLEGRDLVDWANKGWLDTIYYMDYSPSLNTEQVNDIRKKLQRPQMLTMLLGNYEVVDVGKIVPRDPDLLSRLIYETRINWPNTGLGVYFYKAFSDAQMQSLATGPFVKRIPTKDIVAPSAPTGLVAH